MGDDYNKLLNEWVGSWTRRRSKNVCKPCWELNYCPYGPLVEQFPPCIPTRKEAREHNQFLLNQMKSGAYNNDKKKKRQIQKDIDEFDPKDYPLSYTHEALEKFCGVFGHVCPVS
jgi:hypothetical protein